MRLVRHGYLSEALSAVDQPHGVAVYLVLKDGHLSERVGYDRVIAQNLRADLADLLEALLNVRTRRSLKCLEFIRDRSTDADSSPRIPSASEDRLQLPIHLSRP